MSLSDLLWNFASFIGQWVLLPIFVLWLIVGMRDTPRHRSFLGPINAYAHTLLILLVLACLVAALLAATGAL